MDYTYLYKHSYQRIDEIQNLLPYDIFISSYVNSQRVQEPADNIQAGQKIWFATYNRGIQMYRFPNSDVQKSVIFEGIKKRLKIV